ncbi:TIGR03936 family radical SAM-associated protein [Jatrophihabitans sp.]|uniref:TIGR03936 family radical SAM-associated protein n=1 Tax=Jatrophihabitans sp. TaxID=1932789 RepID=UPI0038CDA4DA
MQRIRLQYAKRGRLRFCSHRDFARAFERSLRRAEVPMAYSAGFHPHPKISYLGAAPTGVGSEAEYLEIGLARHCEPEAVRAALDSVLPDGLDIVRAVDAADCRPGTLAEQMHASLWRLELAADPAELTAAVARLLAAESVPVERLTKDGRRTLDARAPIVSAQVSGMPAEVSEEGPAGEGPAEVSAEPIAARNDTRAILEVVVRQVTPAVRPDDVLTALRTVAGFAPSQPPRATRLAQGPVDDAGRVTDPLCTTGSPA